MKCRSYRDAELVFNGGWRRKAGRGRAGGRVVQSQQELEHCAFARAALAADADERPGRGRERNSLHARRNKNPL